MSVALKLYEILEQQMLSESITVAIEPCLQEVKATYISIDNRPFVLLSPSIANRAERTCLLAEEFGHFMTAPDSILLYDKSEDIRLENRARQWAYRRLLPPRRISEALTAGHVELYQLAEELDVTEEFLIAAIKFYRQKGLFQEGAYQEQGGF